MQMKFIDLDELNDRIKQLKKPTPFQVIDLITEMYTEIRFREECTV